MFAVAGRPVVGEKSGNRDDESDQPKETSSSGQVGACAQSAVVGGRTAEGAVVEYRCFALLHDICRGYTIGSQLRNGERGTW